MTASPQIANRRTKTAVRHAPQHDAQFSSGKNSIISQNVYSTSLVTDAHINRTSRQQPARWIHWSSLRLSRLRLPLTYAAMLLLLVSSLIQHSHATQFAQRNGIFIDTAPLPSPEAPLHAHLYARQTTAAQATFTLISSTEAATAPSSESTAVPTALPQPFDSSLGNNFTTSTCPNFFRTFLNDKEFQECIPFSLLVQTSKSFFSAAKSFFRTTQILDASCSVQNSKCSSLMANYGSKIKLSENCGADLAAQNPLVLQAYAGLSAYNVMYQAGCEKDSNGDYCFANAITNSSNSADSYPYFLPLGLAMPNGTRPTCSACLKRTMQIFAVTASNGSQLISKTYSHAAEQINTGCGPDWVVPRVEITSAGRRETFSTAGLLFTALASLLLIF